MNIAPGLINFLSISMLVSSLLVTLIYSFFNWKSGLLGKMVSITLCIITFGILTHYLSSQNLFIHVPHLYRTGQLALLLITPMVYISLKIAIHKKVLSLKTIFHFIPALIYFFNYLPFYFYSAQEKMPYITKVSKDRFDAGWLLPQYFELLIIIGQIFFYLALISANIIMNPLSQKQSLEREKKLTYVFIIYLILLLLPPISTFYADFMGSTVNTYIDLVYIASQTIFFTILLNNPHYIYHSVMSKEAPTKPKEHVLLTDMEQIPTPKLKIKGPELVYQTETNEKVKKILDQIEKYFLEKKPFLDFEFTQKDLAEDLDLSNYQIRTTLNSAYSISFSDYVNYHRINYLVTMISEDSKWKTYSTINLSKSIGFKSSNSFYLAFKKFLGKTPKEFLDEVKLAPYVMSN